MTRIHLRLEQERSKADSAAQDGLNRRADASRKASEQARDAATRRCARDEADRLCADRSEREAIVYASAFLKRVKENANKRSSPLSPQEAGEVLFSKRGIAA